MSTSHSFKKCAHVTTRPASSAWSLALFISLENLFDKNFINNVAPQSGLNHSINNDTAAVFSGQGFRWQIGIESKF